MRLRGHNRISFCARLFLLALILPPGLLQAQEAHRGMKPALVRIEAFGETPDGEPIEAFGTGVILTADGDILTALHVLAPLEESDPSKIDIFVRIGEAAANQRRASSISSIEARDLALLLIDDPPENLTYACRTTSGDRPDSLPLVLTSGFEGDGTYVRRQAEIIGNGTRGTIIVDMAAAEAQSGSPVYTDSGEVVGILKGIREGRVGESLFVPLNNVLGQLPTLPATCVNQSSSSNQEIDLQGASVYTRDANGASLRRNGEISEVIYDGNGSVIGVVIEIGAFLGIGGKPVFLPIDAISLSEGANGELDVYLNSSQEDLEELPAYLQ